MINLPETPNCTLLVVSFSTHVHTKVKQDPSHQCPVTRGSWHRLKYKTFNSKLRERNGCESSQALEEVSQACHRAFTLRNNQNTTGHSLEQPVLSREVRLDELQRFLLTTAILWPYDHTTTYIRLLICVPFQVPTRTPTSSNAIFLKSISIVIQTLPQVYLQHGKWQLHIKSNSGTHITMRSNRVTILCHFSDSPSGLTK